MVTDAYFVQYETWLSEQTFTQSTRRNYAAQVRLFLDFVRHMSPDSPGAAVSLNQRDMLVEKYTDFLQNSAGACPSSIYQSRTSIDNFYQFLGLGPSTIERKRYPQKLPRVLTPSEKENFVKALEASGSTKDKAVIALFLFAGIRLNECASLDVDDLSITAHTGKLIVCKRKHGRNRELSLDETTRKAVLAWLIERSETFPDNSDKALFVNSKGQRLSHSAVDLIVRKIGIRAGLVLSAQVLRDTYLADLAQKTQDIFLVAAIGGCKYLDSARRYFEVASASSESNIAT